ncbi:Fanconi anemia group M helicase [Carabus blaptoides fortunei]
MNDSFDHIESLTQLCKEQDTFGFDLNAGQTWVYPTNLPIREYQFSITEKALYENTMVCLPTGLGKTFIAAVVMYNFYRWYPMGKIIFMAPTKPLVAQQLDACYNIMAIPNNVTAEITGTKDIGARECIWKEKRVFFITPQILQNDIETVLELAPQIRCIVVDEAHKALGKHAYCEAIKKIVNLNTNFRVLALSATPGSNFNAVRDVITNLLISHIEVRTNESLDVVPYIFQRKLDTVVIPITGKLLEVKNEYIKILDTYTRPLMQANIIAGNCANITKGRIVLIMKEFKERSRQHSNYSSILRNLNICITLYHGYELLVRHGLRGFLTFFEGNISKPLIRTMHDLHAILEHLRDYLGPSPAIEMLPDGTIPEITGDIVFSHPKFTKLSEVLLEHLAQVQDTDSRIMVFCEYRESVMETYSILLRHRPTIKPRIFLGQGAISQAQQIQTVRMFKSGACNTLVSTCIGEEGLDVGEVDLIVCFDISTKSPIRMVQRMGRTGRKRDGRVVVLVTEGKEQQLLKDCLAQKTSMISLLDSQPIKTFLYARNPRMIPASCQPECQKMFITVQQREPAKKKAKTVKKNTVKSMFANMTSSQTSTSTTNSEQSEEPKQLSDSTAKWIKSPAKGKTSSPVKKAKKSLKKPDINKQHDLRSMFTKLNNTQSTVTSTSTEYSTAASSQTSFEPEHPKLTALLEQIQSYLSSDNNNSECLVCDNLFACNKHATSQTDGDEWTVPDELILDRITGDALTQYMQTLGIGTTEIETSLNYFNLDSITDIFSDDSTEYVAALNPIMFTQSFGEFSTPGKVAVEEDDDIVESDTESSPTLRSLDQVFGAKVQRKLFAKHSSTPNVNLTKNGLTAEKINNTTNNQATVTVTAEEINNTTKNQARVHSNLTKCDTLTDEVCTEYDIITPKLITNQLTPTISYNRAEIIDMEQKAQLNTALDVSPIVKSSANKNFEIWDDSIFETSDVEDFKLWITPEKSSSSCDSDETVMLSFDENNFERAKNTSHVFETRRTSVNSENVNNKSTSLCNKSENSLLSITQMIDCLNESKKQVKLCKNADNSGGTVQNNSAQVLTKNVVEYSTKSSLEINRIHDKLTSVIVDNKTGKRVQNSPVNSSSLWISPNRTQKLNMSRTKTDNPTFGNSPILLNKSHYHKPNTSQNYEVSDENSPHNSQELNSSRSNSSSTQDKHVPAVVNDELDIQTILKDMKFSSDDEPSLLSFSQNVRNNRQRKKFKLQLTQRSTDATVKPTNITSSQESPLKVKKAVNTKKTLVLSDSDDDFAMKPTWKKVQRTQSCSKMDAKQIKSRSQSESRSRKDKKRKQLVCEFIDDEAAVKDDEHFVADSQQTQDSVELLDSSFINDTQSICDQSDMQAKYLQSVRSPKFGAFKMPAKQTVYLDVFSQDVDDQNDTYMNDSFCVGNDDTLSQRNQMSYLEVAEAELERQRKSKKRKRIIRNSDSDST